MDIKNNGHSVQVTLPSNSYFMRGGGLSCKYQALQFHFHWGSDCTKGSEHSMDGVTYPAEMHIVHRKVGLTADEALQVKDGLAVLAVMIKIGCQTNRNFDAIVKSLSVIPKSGDATTTSGNISLDNLLPDNRQDFFRYYGSLTTPTCDESVAWTVFADPVEISENQITAFRALYFDKAGSEHMVNNFRPIQALNGRTVTRYGFDAFSSDDDDRDRGRRSPGGGRRSPGSGRRSPERGRRRYRPYDNDRRRSGRRRRGGWPDHNM